MIAKPSRAIDPNNRYNLLYELFGDENGEMLRQTLVWLMLYGPEEFKKAIDRLDHLESMGPVLDPSAWTNGKRFKDARNWKEIFEHLKKLAHVLQQHLNVSEESPKSNG